MSVFLLITHHFSLITLYLWNQNTGTFFVTTSRNPSGGARCIKSWTAMGICCSIRSIVVGWQCAGWKKCAGNSKACWRMKTVCWSSLCATDARNGFIPATVPNPGRSNRNRMKLLKSHASIWRCLARERRKMQQTEKPHRVNEVQVFERCVNIAETPMEWADEQGCRLTQGVHLNVKNQFPADPRKAPRKILQSLGENPALWNFHWCREALSTIEWLAR